MKMTLDFSKLAGRPTDASDAALAARLRQVADYEVFRHALPKSAAGFGDGFARLIEIHQQLGQVCRDPGLMLAVNAHLWGSIFPIWLYGSDAQKALFLPKLLSGQWLAGHAITEPDCGSDVQAMTACAEATSSGYRLHGRKTYITNAPIADWMIVYAKLDGKITAFLLAKDDPGCTFSGDNQLAVCKGSATGSVYLDACELDASRLLGRPGAGAQMIQKALEYERAFVFAGIAGAMQWQLHEVVGFSRTRRSGGVHVGKHQAVSHRIADMKLRLDTIKLWLNECARLADAGQRLTLVSAQTKLYAAEAFLQSSLDAVQIFGACSLKPESEMLGLVQDALAGRLFSGSSEVQKNLIAGLLGSGDAYRSNVSP